MLTQGENSRSFYFTHFPLRILFKFWTKARETICIKTIKWENYPSRYSLRESFKSETTTGYYGTPVGQRWVKESEREIWSNKMDINDIINQNKLFITKFIKTTLERYTRSKEFVWTSDLELGFRISFCSKDNPYHIFHMIWTIWYDIYLIQLKSER